MVSEDGVSTVDSFTVVLDSQPLSDVVVKLISDSQPDVTVSVSTLTFQPDNWNVAQTVNLSGLDDDQDDGDEQTTITIQVDDAASDNAFDDVDDQTIIVTTTDDDAAGVTLSKTTAQVSEDGTTVVDSFDVVLDAQPIADVVLELTLSDSPDAAVDRSTLLFTSQNWDTPQTVNIYGLDDDIGDGDEQTTLTIAVNDAESDAAYDLLADQVLIVTTSDDDTAGFSLNKARATVSEDGTSATDTFSIVLNSQPLANVVLNLSLSDNPDAAVSPNRVTFTPQNWDTAQSVEVTGWTTMSMTARKKRQFQ